MKRINYSSGSPLEKKVGYSRMVKIGNRVLIGGTTSVQPGGSVYGEDNAYEQTRYILKKQIRLLENAGAAVTDVIKIDAFLTDMAEAEEVAKAYSEFFKEVKPLFTAVGIAQLNRPAQKVEISLEAVIGYEI